MKIQSPRGTKDVLPAQSYQWHYIENMMRKIAADYGFREIRTPVFEHTELFLRGVGDTSDIVTKEMYTFMDKGDRSITLKPEGTAGVVRAYIEHGMSSDVQPIKMYYLNCPVFRYEAPQAGRLREHHQFGLEIFGAKDAAADAELIALVDDLLHRLGITQIELRINNIGCPKCRPNYHRALRDYFAQYIDQMCPDCKVRFEKNPLRILDCKKEHCQSFVKNAPMSIDYACEECSTHFERTQSLLHAGGIEFQIDSQIVRGLDYYTKTVFEFVSTHIGSQGTVCGGGRYDVLVEQLGGNPTPGVGFGMGLERLLMVMEGQGLEIPQPRLIDLYIAHMGEKAQEAAFALAQKLRKRDIKVQFDVVGRGIKAQMKYADKMNAAYVAVLGEDELANGLVKCKNMNSGEEVELSLNCFENGFCEILTKE